MISVRAIPRSSGFLGPSGALNVDVAPGGVVCIIGPSGSGRSAILRCVNGLETDRRSEIRIDEGLVDPRHRSVTGLRQRVSMVFQRFNLFPHAPPSRT